MRKCLLLTKVLLKTSGSSLTNQSSSKKPSKARSLGYGLLYLFLGLCFVPLMVGIFVLFRELYTSLAPLRLEGLVYDLACLGISFTTLILALPFVISVMFLAKDLEHLLPMPFHTWQITGAKFLSVMVYEYATAAFIGIPAFAGIGAAASAGPSYVLICALVLLALPILPVIYGSFLGILALYLTRRWKNKEAITTIFSILIIFASMGIGMLAPYLDQTASSQKMIQLLTQQSGSVHGLSAVFPNLFLAQNALENSSFLMALLYLGSVILLLALFLLIANRWYLKAVSGMGDSSERRAVLSGNETAKALRSAGPVKTFALREWRLLVRTPVYFLNCVITVLITPFMFLVLGVTAVFQSKDLPGLTMQIRMAAEILGKENLTGILLAFLFLFTTLLCSFNMVASTCISREGSGIADLKSIPVSFRQQLRGKLLCAVCISAVVSLPFTLILVLVGNVFFGASLWLLIPALVITALTILSGAYLELFFDLWKPKLNWTNEAAAVKQNLFATLATFATMAFEFLLFGLCLLLFKLHLPILIIAGVGIAVLAALTFLLRVFVLRFGEQALARLEV